MFPTINGNALRERWGAAPVFELARIIRAGELVPIYEMAGGRRTAEADPCLVCSACEVPNPEGQHGREIECTHSRNGHGEQIPCRGRWEVYARALRINEATFYLREVEEYERAHGWELVQPNPLEEAGLDPKERRELGQLRLEKEKWDASIKAAVVAGMVASEGQPMTKDQLRGALKQNGVSWAEIPDTTFNKIWSAIPERFRNMGGRPKKTASG